MNNIEDFIKIHDLLLLSGTQDWSFKKNIDLVWSHVWPVETDESVKLTEFYVYVTNIPLEILIFLNLR